MFAGVLMFTATGLILNRAFDPFCHLGVINTAMTACCVKDCGSCEENSDVCQDAAKNGRGTTCCPSEVVKSPSCESSMAPCAVPESVRDPQAQEYGDRHAKDDCNKAIPNQDAANHLSTAYIKRAGKKVVTFKKGQAMTESCGTSYSTLAQISAACTDNDDCFGFTTDGSDEPKCLLVAGAELGKEVSSSDNAYLKREDGRAGHTFRFKSTHWGPCYPQGPNGAPETRARLESCETDAGVTKKLALCTLVYAINPDGYAQPCTKVEDMPTTTTTSTTTASGTSEGAPTTTTTTTATMTYTGMPDAYEGCPQWKECCAGKTGGIGGYCGADDCAYDSHLTGEVCVGAWMAEWCPSTCWRQENGLNVK